MPDSNAANRISIRRLLILAGLLCMSMQATSDALAAPSVCASLASPPCHQRLATGVALAYIETGPASGPAVIMVHGLADSLQSWAPAMHALAAIDPRLHLIAVDLRGHGASGMPPARRCAAAPQACFRTKDFAADIAALMDAKKIRRATLVGHSLGSFVVQELALTRPQRVERAVLVATSATAVGNPVLRDVVLRDIVEGSWKKALERPGRAWPAGFYSLTPLEADPQAAPWIAANLLADPLVDPAFMAAAAARTASVRMGTWIGATRALLSTDNTRRLKTLTVPTLVLWGLQDTIFTSTDQDAVKRSLAEAARRHGLAAYWKPYGVLPLPRSGAQESDIGHNVQWTAPRAVARDIAAFIENGKPTRDQVHAGSAPRLLDLVTVPGQAAVTVIGH